MAAPFDLAKFAPNPTVTFRLRSGGVYAMTADPDVDVVARMLRIEEVIGTGMAGGDSPGDALAEGKQLLADLIRDADPAADLAEFKVGAQEMLVIFTLILHGETVADAVLEAIAGPDGVSGSDGQATPGEAGEAVPDFPEGGEVSPLQSVRRSPAQSSVSDEAEDGLPATGTG